MGLAPALANAVKRRGRKEQKICTAPQLLFPEYLGVLIYIWGGFDSSRGDSAAAAELSTAQWNPGPSAMMTDNPFTRVYSNALVRDTFLML